MKHCSLVVGLAAFAWAGMAQAHSHLEKSVPANNSTVSALPKNVVLEFNEATQLTVLTLQKGDDKAQELGPLPKMPVKEITVPMPAVDAGSYIIKWRAAGEDGHVMSGKVLFKVAAPAAAPGQ